VSTPDVVRTAPVLVGMAGVAGSGVVVVAAVDDAGWIDLVVVITADGPVLDDVTEVDGGMGGAVGGKALVGAVVGGAEEVAVVVPVVGGAEVDGVVGGIDGVTEVDGGMGGAAVGGGVVAAVVAVIVSVVGGGEVGRAEEVAVVVPVVGGAAVAGVVVGAIGAGAVVGAGDEVGTICTTIPASIVRSMYSAVTLSLGTETVTLLPAAGNANTIVLVNPVESGLESTVLSEPAVC